MTSCLIESLDRTACERPEDIALIDSKRTVTWAQLRAEVEQQSFRFARMGPRPRVISAAGNGIALATLILGALRAGGEIHGVSPRTPPAALASLAESISAVSILSDHEMPGSSPIQAPPMREPPPPSQVPSSDGAILLTTSGTTGHPRVVVRDAAAASFSAMNAARAMALDATSCSLLAIPLFHTYGIDQLAAALMAGARVWLLDGFTVAATRKALRSGVVTHFPAVPTMLDALARAAKERGDRLPLRVVVSAGSALPERVSRAFSDAYSMEVGQVYGSTELGTVAATRPGDPFGCVGRPLSGVQVRVLRADGEDAGRPLPSDAEGVIAISAPSRFERYLDDSEKAPAEVLTGDLGRIDPAGRLWLTGRASLLIDVGAVKVNPLEVEAVLMRHPGVREAVVLPLAFSETGSRLRAVIVPEEEGRAPTRDALRRFARERLVDYKVPRVFDIRADVPRSPTGKILRQELLRSAP